MFKLFLSPTGLLSRKSYCIAIIVYAVSIFALERLLSLIGANMTTFWLGLIAFPVLIYSFYQVCKKRLHDMGYTARPFWIWLFLLFFLWVGAALYLGVGEHFNFLFEYQDQFNRGEISEDKMLELIAAREKVMSAKLAEAGRITEILLTIPAALFLLWLAATPGQQKDA